MTWFSLHGVYSELQLTAVPIVTFCSYISSRLFASLRQRAQGVQKILTSVIRKVRYMMRNQFILLKGFFSSRAYFVVDFVHIKMLQMLFLITWSKITILFLRFTHSFVAHFCCIVVHGLKTKIPPTAITWNSIFFTVLCVLCNLHGFCFVIQSINILRGY